MQCSNLLGAILKSPRYRIGCTSGKEVDLELGFARGWLWEPATSLSFTALNRDGIKNTTNLFEQKAACLDAKKGISFKAETLHSLWRNCGAALWALFLASPLHPPPLFPVWKSLPRGSRCLPEADEEHHLVVAQTIPWRWQRISKWSQGWQTLHRLHTQIHPAIFAPSPPPSSLLFITMLTEGESSCKNYTRSHPRPSYCCCSVAKSCPTLWPHGLQYTSLPCPSLSPGVHSNSCPLNWWSYLTISSSAALFFWLQSFPPSGSFPMNRLSPSDGQNIGASASASVLPMNIQGWVPLVLTGLTQDHGCTSTPKSSSAIQEGAPWRPSEKAASTHWGPQQVKIPNRML